MTEMDLQVPAHIRMPPATTPEQQRAASLAVCARSTDIDDARELLDMLGLRQELRP